MAYHYHHNKRRDFETSTTLNSLVIPQNPRNSRFSPNERDYSEFETKYPPLDYQARPSSKVVGSRDHRSKFMDKNASHQKPITSKFKRFQTTIPSWLNKLTPTVEGRKSLRAISFFGGIASTIASVIAISHVQKLLLTPPVAILLVYQLFFGVATVAIEAKDLKILESVQPWINEWFPFLLEPLGKGFLYILMGVLGLSIWQNFFYVAAAGGFMCFIGCLYLIISCGGHTKLQQHVGIELTQHPGRGGKAGGNIPALGYHRQRYPEHKNSPRFGPQHKQGYYSIDAYETMDPMLTGTEALEADTTSGLHSDWSKGNQFPPEFVDGMRQFQQEQTYQ